jgi:spermidine synthase
VKGRSLAYASVAIVSACGMVYELSLGTLASYVLGSAVREFSIVLGLYVSAMGAGAWTSSRVTADVWRSFLVLELVVGLVGGLSAPLLFLCVGKAWLFPVVLYACVLAVGAAVGAELPLLMRGLEGSLAFKDLVGRGFALDYLGALFASLLFPLVLVPVLGLVRTTSLFGICNVAVALVGTWALPGQRRSGLLRAACATIVALLLLVTFNADAVVAHAAD